MNLVALSASKRFTVVTAILVALLLAVAVIIMSWGTVGRRLTAKRLYQKAVAAYMLKQVDECEKLFEVIADRYGDLPIGALAELKIAFLSYDQHEDLNGAETLFLRFLKDHPDGVMYISDAPLPEYNGELELVAFYFLGKIAIERGDNQQGESWFKRIVKQGSRNPANIMVGQTKALLQRMQEESQIDSPGEVL